MGGDFDNFSVFFAGVGLSSFAMGSLNGTMTSNLGSLPWGVSNSSSFVFPRARGCLKAKGGVAGNWIYHEIDVVLGRGLETHPEL